MNLEAVAFLEAYLTNLHGERAVSLWVTLGVSGVGLGFNNPQECSRERKSPRNHDCTHCQFTVQQSTVMEMFLYMDGLASHSDRLAISESQPATLLQCANIGHP